MSKTPTIRRPGRAALIVQERRFLGLLASLTATAAIFAGCGDDFERLEANGVTAGPDSTINDTKTADSTANDSTDNETTDNETTPAQDTTVVDVTDNDANAEDGHATDGSGSKGDAGATGSSGGFPGNGVDCTAAKDCGDAPAPCIEWACVSGGCKLQNQDDATVCDDGEKCTEGDLCKAGECEAGKSTCTCVTSADCDIHEDGDLCNGTLFCNKEVSPAACVVNPKSVIECDAKADHACAANACDPKTAKCSMAPTNEAGPCNDGNDCSISDACKQGECAGQPGGCECKVTADCAAKEDNDSCNGTLYCNRSEFPFTCKVNPTTVVVCTTTSDTTCSQNKCDPKTLKCAMTAQPDGLACDDADKCTDKDLCDKGLCLPGASTCTCVDDADCDAFDDGNPCNGTLYCAKSGGPNACKVNPSTVVSCDAANDVPCLENVCSVKDGVCAMTAVDEGEVCDDGNVCTSIDKCTAGTCKAGPNSCACTSDAMCAPFEDGNACNGTLFCDKSAPPFKCQVLQKTITKCQGGENTECAVEKCDPADGKCKLEPINEGGDCNADDNACTVKDACTVGVCSPGANACTCAIDADCAGKEDGDLCNGTLYCEKSGAQSTCKVHPLTVVVCPLDNFGECKDSDCNPKTGKCELKPINEGQPCDADDKKCTTDACKAGKCEVFKDECACVTDTDCGSLNDLNNKCSGTYKCDKSGTKAECAVDPASLPKCATKTEECIELKCDPTTGSCKATQLKEGDECSDDQACSVGDACNKAGKCEPGEWLCACGNNGDCAIYDDKNPCNGAFVCDKTYETPTCVPVDAVVCPPNAATCTTNACNPISGKCEEVAEQAQEGAGCDDNKKCTANDVCQKGVCKGTAPTVCPDGEPCRIATCDEASGCATKSAPNKTKCNDGKVCTSGDECFGGTCQPTLAAACPPAGPNSCVTIACVEPVGCKSTPVADGTKCDDGSACTPDDTCESGKCTAKPAKCDDGNACTASKCDNKKCVHDNLTTGSPCKTGDLCATTTQCDTGVCKVVGTKDCNDKLPCTSDACDAKTGLCKYTTIKAGTPCPKGDKCNPAWTCEASTNGGTSCTQPATPPACDDNDHCTDDSCNNIKGCVYAPTKACDDGEICSVSKCLDGGCTYAPANEGKVCAGTIVCKAGSCGNACNMGWKLYATPTSGSTTGFTSAAAVIGKSSERLYVLAGHGSGSSGVAGSSGAGGKTGGVGWTVVVAPAGKVLSEDAVKTTGLNWVDVAVGDKTKGNVRLVCVVGQAPTGSVIRVMELDKKNALVHGKTVTLATKEDIEVALLGTTAVTLPQANGTVCFAVGTKVSLAGGAVPDAGKVYAVGADAKPITSRTFSDKGGSSFSEVAAQFDGVIAVGSTVVSAGSGPDQGLVLRFDAGLSKVEWAFRDAVKGAERFNAVAIQNSKTARIWVAGTIAKDSGDEFPVIKEIKEDGSKALWTWDSQTTKFATVSALELGPEGGLYLAGSNGQLGQTQRAMMARVSTLGAHGWLLFHTNAAPASFSGLLHDGDYMVAAGDVAATTNTKPAKPANALLFRTNAKGQQFCSGK